jgi:hypothetical protein
VLRIGGRASGSGRSFAYHEGMGLHSTLLLAPLLAVAGGEEPVDFSSEVRPLLSDRCFICHGPDEEAREADLRLDLRSGATADREGEAAVVPGHPEQSLLLERLRHPKVRRRMPPADSKLSMSEDEIALFERWIAEGATYAEHWAFVAPVRPPLPPVGESAWPADDLDRIVLAHLESAGLKPTVEAERATWLRRVSFDLNGLPPTLEELDAFLSDEAADAHERVVDRLLASPRYGERMATEWLDVARYSDTFGYQTDVERRVWPWRDWVVRAFNEDLAWDEFATWQLAGDLLPEPTHDQRLATAFNRLHRQTNEGGSTEEEYRVEYVADRVHTFGTAFLGLTMECARCHDHKYDSVTQEEYYRLFAFFDDIDECGLYSHFTNAVPTPTMWLPDSQQASSLEALAVRRDDLESALLESEATAAEGFEAWLAELSEPVPVAGRQAAYEFEGQAEGELPNALPEGPAGRLGAGVDLVESRGGQVVRLNGDGGVVFAGVGAFNRDDPFTIAMYMKPAQHHDRAVIFHRSRAWTDAGSRGYQLLFEDGRLSASLIHFWPGNAICVRARDQLEVGEWSHVVMTYDGSSRAAGLVLFVNGKRVETEVVRDKLTRTILGGGDLSFTIGERFRDRGFAGGEVDDLEIFERRLVPMEVGALAAREERDLAKEVSIPLDEMVADPDGARELFVAAIATGPVVHREELHVARRTFGAVVERVPEIMVMEALPEPRRAYLLERGSYLMPAHEVQPATPASVGPFPVDERPDRLGLARWLTSEDNPLFARVTVNRLWQQMFGEGLVSTTENFGSQGAAPAQRELLDYLALELRGMGWSVKGFLRRVALSATYRQSSRAPATALESDPGNEHLARGPLKPLSAEMVRDNALFVSGLLVEELGGPPVKPYQPPGLWQEKSGAVYQADKGAGLWRRSLYSYWKLTSPPPSMVIFDASKRDTCVVRRQRTTSPLQALALWNDPQQVEAGRVLAQRVLAQGMTLEGDAVDGERLATLFRLCTSQVATAAELEVLGELLVSARADFRAAPESVEVWLSIGEAERVGELDPVELAALAVVGNTLLGYDGTVTLR